MTRQVCAVRTCSRPATWRLEATHDRRGTRVLASCSRHLDGLSTRLETDIGTPSCAAIGRAAPIDGPPLALFDPKKEPTMPTPTLTTPLPRDRWSRPLVVPPGGGRAIPYTRATTFVGCIEDTFQLSRWQQRMVATGLSQRPDLLLAVSAHRDDKTKLDMICGDALEAAKAHAAATTGTALHALCEQIDRGQDIGAVPEAYQGDLAAYRDVTAGMEHHYIESFTVLDDLKIGGTPDRISTLGDWRGIVDIKTGSIEYGTLKIAMQLAVYAHCVGYNHEEKTRYGLGGVDLDTALVIHLPAGQGQSTLVEVDIAAGWEAVQVATSVRQWRARKDLTRPRARTDAGPGLADRVRGARSVDELVHLWGQGNAAGTWTDALTEAAAARKAELAQAVAS